MGHAHFTLPRDAHPLSKKSFSARKRVVWGLRATLCKSLAEFPMKLQNA